MQSSARPFTPSRVFCSLLPWVFVAFTTSRAQSSGTAQRQLEAVSATPSGSSLTFAINQADTAGTSELICIAPPSGKVLWHLKQLPTIGSVATAPNGTVVAVGLVGVPDRDYGVLLLDAQTGKQVGGLGLDPKSYFMPGTVYPRFGSGVSQLAYSPDGSILYGLSNDTLFAWDVTAQRYLWTTDVPAVIQAPADLTDPLPYGHATGFALSPDGRQIGAVRDAVRVAAAGRVKPPHFIPRDPSRGLTIEAVAFSSNSRILAAGEVGSQGASKAPTYATDLWINGALKSTHIDGCGGAIAWTADPNIFGCQDAQGTHLRNINAPQADVGPTAPASDLPILKVGNSLWSVAYRSNDWKNATKSLPLTLVELGSGRRITVTLPGEAAPPIKKPN